jgi:hypothetical protein
VSNYWTGIESQLPPRHTVDGPFRDEHGQLACHVNAPNGQDRPVVLASRLALYEAMVTAAKWMLENGEDI